MFKLPQLPYSKSALEPFISTETIDYHYGKHHNETNRLIQGTRFESSTLEEIVLFSEGALFNNASQAWNHSFYWKCMHAADKDGSAPSKDLNRELKSTFGSIEKFKSLFEDTAVHLLGSGWVWLVIDTDLKMRIVTLPNADSPMRRGLIPLLTCDVWEHAYYIDYRNNRKKYVEGFMNAVDWAFVSKNFASDQIPDMTGLMLEKTKITKKTNNPDQHSVA